jgi:hypothetical protein
MGAAREADQADFDLDRFVDMFDEAMTSKDPRVVETLRSLMMIVTLTRPETYNKHDRRSGPLRRLFEEMHDLTRRVGRMEEEQYQREREKTYPIQWPTAEDKYTMAAAAKMAQSIDDDVMRKVSMKINSGSLAQLNPTQSKGLIKK